MPTISMLYGIIINVYYYDDEWHKLPHIHANVSSSGRLLFNYGWIPSGWANPAHQSELGSGMDRVSSRIITGGLGACC